MSSQERNIKVNHPPELEAINGDEFSRNGLIPSLSEMVLKFELDIEKLPSGQRNILPDFYRAQRWLAKEPAKPVKGRRLMRGLEKRINYQELEEENPGLLNDIASFVRSRREKKQKRSY